MQKLEIVIPENIGSIALYSETEKALAELRGKYKDLHVDCTTTAGMELAKLSRRELVQLRTGLETKRKELKAPALEYGKQIDAQAKRITAEIEALEQPIDAKIKAEEFKKEAEKQARIKAEHDRIAAIQAQIAEITNAPAEYAFADAAKVAEAIGKVEACEINAAYGEFIEQAEAAKLDALEKLYMLHARRIDAEAEAARVKAEREALERERAEQAAKAKQEAEAQAKKLAEERSAFERQQAEERAKLEAERKRHEAELAEARRIQEEADRKARAERDAIEAAERKKREAQEAAERKEREAAEAKARAEREAEEKRLAGERAELARQKADEDRRARMEVLSAIIEVVDDAAMKDKDARKQIGILARRALAHNHGAVAPSAVGVEG
jgi:colicin import membrane protein